MPLDSFGLGPERSISYITYDDFKSICDKYTTNERETLDHLDYFRRTSIPETLAQRKQDGCVFLEKTELMLLAEWRRKHDHQHATTPGILASLSIPTVRQVTHAAFTIYSPNCHYQEAIKKLQELEGVSFPIATLILSSYDPLNIPYFTEGFYRWTRGEDAAADAWDRKLDYIMKQYRPLVEHVAQLRFRLRAQSGVEVSALDVESVGRQINEWAVERRKQSEAEGREVDDFLLRPLGPEGKGSGTYRKRKLDPTLSEGERVPKHPPKKGKEAQPSAVASGSPAVSPAANGMQPIAITSASPAPNGAQPIAMASANPAPNGMQPIAMASPSPAPNGMQPIANGIPNPFTARPAGRPTIPKAFKPDKKQFDDGRWRPSF